MAQRRAKKLSGSDAHPSPAPFAVDMTAAAEAVYSDLYRKAKEAEKAGNYASNHCTTFNMVREAIKRIIPSDPLNPKHGLRGEFANVFRLRKGRLRICWIASSKIRRILILFISETLRKDGDASDPYILLQTMVHSGAFDSYFQGMGVRMSHLRSQGKTNKPN